jgi:tetratricopeptide (TPR) repeat protein
MSQRRKTLRTPEASPNTLVLDRRAELLRRIVLGFVTALIVARPLVLGEDPGWLVPFSGIANPFLTVLWFLAAVGWALWRAWAPEARWDGHWLEIPFAILVAITFVSAWTAHYQHPAFLIAWEWLIMLLAFGLVRRLARTALESRGLLAALLATGVSLGGYALYQYFVELPRDRVAFADPEVLRRRIREQLDVNLAADDPQLENWRKRISQDNAFATFTHPNSFAGFLALLLPSAVGLAIVSMRKALPPSLLPGRAREIIAWASVALLSAGLILTHSRGAIVATFVVALGALILALARRRLGINWLVWGGAASAFAIVAVLLVAQTPLGSYGLDRAGHSLGLRTGYWAATWDIIKTYPVLGVGPGNFGRIYPQFMDPRAAEKIQDPHNLFLEVWACSGILAMLTLLVLLAGLFWNLRGVWRQALTADVLDSGDDDLKSEPSIPWEFYAGGLAGLVLAFLLRAAELDGWQIIAEALLSAGRALTWCLAFAAFASVRWAGPGRCLAIAGGVLAMLINFLVSGGFSHTSVTLPLWAMAALALRAAPFAGRLAPASARVARALPLAISSGLGLAYFLMVFMPVSSCATYLGEARNHYGEMEGVPGWLNSIRPRLEKSPSREAQAGALPYLQDYILKPLAEATEADPGNSHPHLELTKWLGERWLLLPAEDVMQRALQQVQTAEKIDPDNRECFISEYRLRLILAERDKQNQNLHYAKATKALRSAVERDPTEARLHFILAEALFVAGDPVQGRVEAKAARTLDEESTDFTRQLDAGERLQLSKWLEAPKSPHSPQP